MAHNTSIQQRMDADVVMDSKGNFVAVWTQIGIDFSPGIGLQRFDRHGNRIGAVVNVTEGRSGVQQTPAIAMDSSGNFIVVFEDGFGKSSGQYNISMQRFNADGTTSGAITKVNTGSLTTYREPDVAISQADGRVAVVYHAGSSDTSTNVYYNKFDAAGTAVGTDTKVNDTTENHASYPAVAFGLDGRFAVAWEDNYTFLPPPNPPIDSTYEIYWRYVTFDTGAVENVIRGSVNYQDAARPDIAIRNNSTAVHLCWTAGHPTNTAQTADLIKRSFLSHGFPVDPTNEPATIFAGAVGTANYPIPEVKITGAGGSLKQYSFASGGDAYIQIYNGLDAPLGPAVQANATTTTACAKAVIAADPSSTRFVVVFQGTRTLGTQSILFQRYARVNTAPNLVAISTPQAVNELNELSFAAQVLLASLNPGDTYTFSLDSGAPAGATIDATSGEFAWTPTEAQGPGSYPITVRATDDGIPVMSSTRTFTVNVAEANLAPTDVALSPNTIQENLPANTVVGTLSTTDGDVPAQTFTYALVSGTGSTDNSAFNISGDQLRLTGSANFEMQSSYAIRVSSTDSMSGVMEKAFTVTVQDVLESDVTDWALY